MILISGFFFFFFCLLLTPPRHSTASFPTSRALETSQPGTAGCLHAALSCKELLLGLLGCTAGQQLGSYLGLLLWDCAFSLAVPLPF